MSIVSVAGSERFAFTIGSRVGPFKVGNWVYFMLLGGWNNLSAADHVLEVWGSENGGPFVELDSANHKTAEWGGFYSFEHSSYLINGKIYGAFWEWDFTAPEWTPQVLLAPFNCATNLWEPTIRGGNHPVGNNTTTDSMYSAMVQIVARATDDIVVVTPNLGSTVPPGPRLGVGFYDGATWDLGFPITGEGYEMAAVGGSNLLCWPVDTILGAGGIVHVFFVQFNMTTAALELKMQTISAANVIGSITKVADIYNPGLPAGGSGSFYTSILSSVGYASYDSISGTVAIPYFNTSHQVAVGLANSEDAPTWSSETVDTTIPPYHSFHLTSPVSLRFPLSTAHWRNGTLEVYWLDDSRNFQKSRRTAPSTWSTPTQYIADSDGRLVFEVPQPTIYDGAGFDRWSATEHQMYQNVVTSRPPVYFMQ